MLVSTVALSTLRYNIAVLAMLFLADCGDGTGPQQPSTPDGNDVAGDYLLTSVNGHLPPAFRNAPIGSVSRIDWAVLHLLTGGSGEWNASVWLESGSGKVLETQSYVVNWTQHGNGGALSFGGVSAEFTLERRVITFTLDAGTQDIIPGIYRFEPSGRVVESRLEHISR